MPRPRVEERPWAAEPVQSAVFTPVGPHRSGPGAAVQPERGRVRPRRVEMRLLPTSGWPSGLRRCVQVAVSPGGVGSNPTPDSSLTFYSTNQTTCPGPPMSIAAFSHLTVGVCLSPFEPLRTPACLLAARQSPAACSSPSSRGPLSQHCPLASQPTRGSGSDRFSLFCHIVALPFYTARLGAPTRRFHLLFLLGERYPESVSHRF